MAWILVCAATSPSRGTAGRAAQPLTPLTPHFARYYFPMANEYATLVGAGPAMAEQSQSRVLGYLPSSAIPISALPPPPPSWEGRDEE